ncbi:DUF5050 domain-containing protein [Clostridium formicaceticum]|uniref:DUF5050 domain-containing protein n=1 Tax=Clostridium formicaceticum TaxID=1497 RepID=A0AAC9WFR5_9CLOT|nr:DUF5050 domain-containing protein [Clostridium formicaceticum]AOY76552.1 DUF5050 domain-containing protein [Clostridium formicaceticum]ARE86969.1 hypothetical protein CLFO_13540 [Clostridium formicaceticum]
MKKKIFLLWTLLALCLILILSPEESFAAESRVRVSLPNFTVKLNGNKVDNQYREYPLLVYKDMTYFPMTWYDCRLLGLETKWSQEEGLSIFQSKVTSSYVSYKTKNKNSNSYNATIPNFKITVNGEVIDNHKEAYPLLNFKQVTYFPLTWRFAHDAFGWEYTWDKAEGLTINSNNPQVKTLDLPQYAGENSIALFEGYCYFVETVENTNKIYRVSEDNTSMKELVYSYEIDTMYGFNTYVEFQIRDQQLWFKYHLGGAVMGSDVYCRVKEDGKATIEQRGYLDFRNMSHGTLKIRHFVPPGGNNLLFVASGQDPEEGRVVGDPYLLYGWHVGATGGYRPDYFTTIIGEEVYLLASRYPIENNDLNKIYKINLNTNTTTRITDFAVRDFKIINNKLYYVKDADAYLYTSNLDGTNEHKLSDHQVAEYNGWYGEIEGNVYYTTAAIQEQYQLYKVDLLKENLLVLKEPLEKVELANDKIICKLLVGEDYGVKVFDASGNLSLAITDQVSNIFVYKDKILMVAAEDQSIKLVK